MPQTSVTIPPSLKEWLKKHAKAAGLSESECVMRLVERESQLEKLGRRKDTWSSPARRGFTPKDVDDAATDASNVAYEAVVGLFEHLEHRQLAHGNGHSMAQEIASLAEKLVREQWIGDEAAQEGGSGE